MALMDLPMELLIQILEDVGGSHLRRGQGTKRLALSKKWYAAAHPIYHSGLDTAAIVIYGSNLKEFEGKCENSSELMHLNTRTLRLRFLGHFWDENTGKELLRADGGHHRRNMHVRNLAPSGTMTEALERWRDVELRGSLEKLFDDLKNFSVLQDFTLEASSDAALGLLGQALNHSIGPHWSYLYTSSVVRMLGNLPITQDLSRLTLDLCGMEGSLLKNENCPNEHLCHSISDILPRVETVRIRTPEICPAIYRLAKMDAKDVKLRNLTIKLHLPNFENTTGPWVKACPGLKDTFNSLHLYQHMAHQGDVFLDGLGRLRNQGKQPPYAHGMTGFRISCVFPRHAPQLQALDCLSKRILRPAERLRWYDDEGSPCWFEFGDMVDSGPFKR